MPCGRQRQLRSVYRAHGLGAHAGDGELVAVVERIAAGRAITSALRGSACRYRFFQLQRARARAGEARCAGPHQTGSHWSVMGCPDIKRAVAQFKPNICRSAVAAVCPDCKSASRVCMVRIGKVCSLKPKKLLEDASDVAVTRRSPCHAITAASAASSFRRIMADSAWADAGKPAHNGDGWLWKPRLFIWPASHITSGARQSNHCRYWASMSHARAARH